MVRMDYRYLQPSDGFYLAVCDNEVVVYLEDRSTIYINTGIALDSLPEKIQMQIMDMLSIPDEKHCMIFWRHILPEEKQVEKNTLESSAAVQQV